MGLWDMFRPRAQDNSASVAKERLQILIAHERARGQDKTPHYFPEMREEILGVIRKYVDVDDDAVRFEVDHNEQYDLFELSITLPDRQDDRRAKNNN